MRSLLLILMIIGFSIQKENDMNLKVTSTAFSEGDMIPEKYTCDGINVSPPLQWEAGPEVTKSYPLISDDPDAPKGTWVHWVVYNIPVNITEFGEDMPPDALLPNGTCQGITDFRRSGYGGPCPPGGTHRYYFKIYALNITIENTEGLTKAELLEEMDGHILAEGQLMGIYKRRLHG